MEEDEIVESLANTLTQREEGDTFQHTMKAERKEYLAYDDNQEQKEEKDDVKNSYVMLEEFEKKGIEDLLIPVVDLGQHEDLVIESSNKTIRSCEFNANKLNVFADCAEGNPFLGVVLSEEEKCLVGKYKDEVLQQKEIENSLLSYESKHQ